MARYVSTPARATGFANRCVYSTPGAYTFTVPDGVTSIKAIAVGGGSPGSTGFVDDYSLITQIACPTACCSCGGVALTAYRCYGYGACVRWDMRQTIQRTPYLLDKYAYAYTGSGGGYAEKTIPVTPGDSFCVTVGDEEESSSFGAHITATGASAPAVVRSSTPCRYGWTRINRDGDSTNCRATLGVCECIMCTPQQAANGSQAEWCTCWFLDGCCTNSSTYYKWSQTLDCPVISLTSNPGCGIGGDVNYTGGPSVSFSVQTLATQEYTYGCPSTYCNDQTNWTGKMYSCLNLCAAHYGDHNNTNCSTAAWDNWLCCYSTYDDLQNNCVGGACAAKLAARNGLMYCGSRRFTAESCNYQDLFEMWCCSCYYMGYKLPAFRTFSSDKQFLEANKSGSSSGSPLGNGQEGGVGCTIFGATTDAQVYIAGSVLCSYFTECSCVYLCFFCSPFVFCNVDCGLKSFNYYSCCPEVAFFDRYEGTYMPEDSDLSTTSLRNFVGLNINPSVSIFSENVTKLPWENKAGLTNTGTQCPCCALQYDPGSYFVCQGGAQCLSCWNRTMGISSCTPCCPGSCLSSRVTVAGTNIGYYSCPGRYCCGTGNISVFTTSGCFPSNCCCTICYNTNCLEGTNTTFVAAFCCQCLIKDNTNIDDVVCHLTTDQPWMKDHWITFKCCAEGEFANDDFKTAWCVACGIFNGLLYSRGFHDPGTASYNCYCNCQDAAGFCLCKASINASCYCPQGGCYGTQCTNHDWRCNQQTVRAKVLTTIDPAAAVVIPGSAGGPNAAGNNGYVLGDNEIYIAGTGADRSGTTQPQYILTGSGASMSKSTFDLIRSKYDGDLMAWYLAECWSTICSDYVNGQAITICGTGYGCLPAYDSLGECSSYDINWITRSHYVGTCCGATNLGAPACMCLNECCGAQYARDYAFKLYACANAEFIRKFNMHMERPEEAGIGNTTMGCERRFTVIDVGSSGGIVVAPKSKAFDGNPLCINTGGGSSTSSYAVHYTAMNQGVFQSGSYDRWIRADCCGVCLNCTICYEEYLTACADDNVNCKYRVNWSCYTCCCMGLPYYSFNLSTQYGPNSACNFNYLEVSKEVGGGSSDVFINETYNGATLSDEYLFSNSDPVFGGTGQICVNGTTLYSLPGLTQGGSVGGCVVRGNASQDVVQTAYSGGIFPKGAPGYGGGGTVCGQGGTGLVVVYWN